MVEVTPSLSGTLNNTIFKSEVDYEQATVPIASVSLTEASVAPPSVTQAQLIAMPVGLTQSFLTSTPATTITRSKRGLRTYLSSKKVNRPSAKPTSVIARPSTLIPFSQRPVLLSNPTTPIVPKAVTSTNPSSGFTTYLVVDGNQGQFVQVSNDGQKPVTFRNQIGNVLQATPITVVAQANQPVVSTLATTGDCSLLSNTSHTITTVRTSSSIDLQQKTTLTNGTTTMTTQQLTGINQQPTTIINGNSLQSYDHNSSLDGSKISNSNLSLSLTQIAEKVNSRHRRSSSSSVSKKKRGRPRLYERDPFTNKPIKGDTTQIVNESIQPNITNTTFYIPGQATTFNTLSNHTNNGGSLIFPNQTTISNTTPSLLQQHQFSYPSLLNGTTSSTNVLTTPTYNTLSNAINPSLSSNSYSYLSQSSFSSLTPTSNLEISSRASSNTTTSNLSPIKSSNNDISVHYIDGFVIRESDHPFLSNDNFNKKETYDQLQCIICQKIDFIQKFFDKEKKFCSFSCSSKSKLNENRSSAMIREPIRPFDNMNLQSPMETALTVQVPLPNDHALPSDPVKWTVLQVGQFIARLTNETIRQAFYESEIDGQALLLITPEHLRDTMKIKLGPSLIIASEIAKLRERAKTFSP